MRKKNITLASVFFFCLHKKRINPPMTNITIPIAAKPYHGTTSVTVAGIAVFILLLLLLEDNEKKKKKRIRLQVAPSNPSKHWSHWGGVNPVEQRHSPVPFNPESHFPCPEQTKFPSI